MRGNKSEKDKLGGMGAHLHKTKILGLFVMSQDNDS